MKRHAAAWLGGLVILAACLILYGWTIQSHLLTSVREDLIATQPVTAIAFIFAGAATVLLHFNGRRQWCQIAGSACAVTVPLIVGRALSGQAIADPTGAVQPGMPSIGTMIGLAVFSLCAIGRLVRPHDPLPRLVAGHFMLWLAVAAVAGYVLGWPALYWHFSPRLVGIALPTLVMFLTMAAAWLTEASECA